MLQTTESVLIETDIYNVNGEEMSGLGIPCFQFGVHSDSPQPTSNNISVG